MNRREFLMVSGKGVLALGMLKSTGCVPGTIGSGVVQGAFAVGQDFLVWDKLGNTYEIRSSDHAVLRLREYGIPMWAIGGQGTDEGQLNYPSSLATDSQGHIYVVDRGNSRIQVFDGDGRFVRTIGGRSNDGTDDPSELDFCRHIVIDENDRVYVCDSYDHHIHVYDAKGNAITQFGEYGDGEGQFHHPVAMAIDRNRYLHVVETGNARVQVFDLNGNYLRTYGSFGDGLGGLKSPRSIAVDYRGNAYVVDAAGMHIDVFGPDGTAREQMAVTFDNGTQAAPLYVTWAPGLRLYVMATPVG